MLDRYQKKGLAQNGTCKSLKIKGGFARGEKKANESELVAG
jgi:hypothetical protein